MRSGSAAFGPARIPCQGGAQATTSGRRGPANQIFVSRGIKQSDCSANTPNATPPANSVSSFCWQQTGIKRIKKDAVSSTAATDPTLNVDPTRDGIEPDDGRTAYYRALWNLGDDSGGSADFA